MDDRETRFAALYDGNYRRVLAFALTRAESHTAEDVASEVFLIAWRRLDDVPAHALPWLLGVARNLLYKQRDGELRRSAQVDRIVALIDVGEVNAQDAADQVMEREFARAVIAAMPERDLEVLTLVAWHGLAPKDAAKVIGCSSAAFFVRLHRARRRLTTALDRAPRGHPPRRLSAVRDVAR